VEALCEAGLDSIRVSMNSVRRECYEAISGPRGTLKMLRSIDTALEKANSLINYLNSPGFTDTPAEAEAFMDFMEDHPIHMIQWRNLNYDPIRYWKAIDAVAPLGEPMGMETLIQGIRSSYPNLTFGYFNPSKEKLGVEKLHRPLRLRRKGRGEVSSF
jgi:hypothetical protein